MDLGLIHLALVISIAGLLLLAFSNEFLEPPLSRIDQISSNSLGKNVHIKGNVSDKHEFAGGSILLSVEDSTGSIDVYLPYDAAKRYSHNSSTLDIIGSVELYKGKLEVVVEDINGLRVAA